MKFITSIILIAAAIAFFIFFTKPQWVELKANRVEVEKLNIAEQNAKNLKERIDGLQKIRNNISTADADKIQRMIPNNVESVKLIIDFDNMLQAMVKERGTLALYESKANLSSGKVSIENPKIVLNVNASSEDIDTTQLGVADFSFTVALTYADFMDFLKRIEYSTRIFDVQSISFTTSNDNKTTNPNDIIYNFNISLKTYWLKS